MLLAIDTATRYASVALYGGRGVAAEHSWLSHNNHTVEMAPAIAAMLAQQGVASEALTAVAVAKGPGSFTGLRVGITAAKTLAYAVGAEVFAVNTLKVIAWQAPSARQRVCAVLDAQRQQLFVADFRRTGEHLAEVSETRILDHADWLAGLTPEVAVTGPGLSGLEDRLPAGIAVVAPACWTPQAATVGRVACLEYLGGARHDLWTLNPRYYRSSAAEEKLGGKSVPDAAGAARKVTG